jgi:sodium transport system permease protein
MQPIVLDDIDVSTPAGRALLVLGMMTYFILFAMLMGGLYLAIDATAGERERGSLEPLLTVPVPRETLIYGKVLAACCYMLVSLAVTLFAFEIGLALVPLGPRHDGEFRHAGGTQGIPGRGSFVPLGAALMTVVASFTRSYRGHRAISRGAADPDAADPVRGALFIAAQHLADGDPSLSQHLLMTNLLRDEPLDPLHVLVSMAATLAASLAMTWIAGRLYQREAILG